MRMLTLFQIAMVALARVHVAAFSIEDVTVLPSNPAPLGSDIKLRVSMQINQSPASLYKPSEVLVSGNQVSVTIFPDRGIRPSITYLTETVSLGSLPLGKYNFEVTLRPPPPFTNGPPPRFTGSFGVQPILKVARSDTNVVLRWSGTATNYVLQAATALPQVGQSWAEVTSRPSASGGEYVLTNALGNMKQFFRLMQSP